MSRAPYAAGFRGHLWLHTGEGQCQGKPFLESCPGPLEGAVASSAWRYSEGPGEGRRRSWQLPGVAGTAL